MIQNVTEVTRTKARSEAFSIFLKNSKFSSYFFQKSLSIKTRSIEKILVKAKNADVNTMYKFGKPKELYSNGLLLKTKKYPTVVDIINVTNSIAIPSIIYQRYYCNAASTSAFISVKLYAPAKFLLLMKKPGVPCTPRVPANC